RGEEKVRQWDEHDVPGEPDPARPLRGEDARTAGARDIPQGARRVPFRARGQPRLERHPRRGASGIRTARPGSRGRGAAAGSAAAREMTEPSDKTAPPPAPAVSAPARVVGTFFSPVSTFQSIAARPGFLLPILLWTAASLLVTAFLLPKIDFDGTIRTSLGTR